MISETPDNVTLPARNVNPALLSALFENLATPFETTRKRVFGAFSVNLQNIEDLCHRMNQTVCQYNLSGGRCEFSLSIKEGGVYRFTSLEKLISSNLNAFSKRVIALGIEFDFLIIGHETNSVISDREPQAIIYLS